MHYNNDGLQQAVMYHEAAHASLDSHYYKTKEWKDAHDADPAYISKYARDWPQREDIAETFGVWLVVRCRKE